MSRKVDQEEFVLELIACQHRLRGFLRCLLVAPADLDDLLQETNRVLLKKSHSFKPGSDFWAWACQVARFEVIAHHRRRSRDRHLYDTELIGDLASRAESQLGNQTELTQQLEHCLKGLSETQSKLLKVRYWDGLSIQRIADDWGRPLGSIRQTLYRLRQQLRSCLELHAGGNKS